MRERQQDRRRGFTLIEVMIVIAIVLALAALVTVNLIGRKRQATGSLAEIDLNSLKAGLKQFYLDYDRWPTEDEGLAVLWDKERLDPEADANRWHKYLEKALTVDRWGTEWGYRQMSEHGDESECDLWSFGPDKQEGTEDDIVSWTKEDEAMPDGTGGTPAGGGPSGGGG